MNELSNNPKLGQLHLTIYKPQERYANTLTVQKLLFEYSSLSNYSGKIYRSRADLVGNSVIFISTKDAANGKAPRFDYQELLSTKIKKQAQGFEYLIEKPEQLTALSKLSIQTLKKLPFICLAKRFKTTKRQIKLKDIIKIGSAFLKVIYIGNVPEKKAVIEPQKPIEIKDDRVCRFCHQNEETEKFITPCKCSGSLGYIHFSCLKQWINHGIEKPQKGKGRQEVIPYICKHPLSNSQNINNNVSIIQFDRSDENPYIVLQTLTFNKNVTLFKVTPKDKKITIDSCQGNDIYLPSQNIRGKAEISFAENKFYIQDKDSQSGTLILIKDQIKFEDHVCVSINNRAYYMQAQTRNK